MKKTTALAAGVIALCGVGLIGAVSAHADGRGGMGHRGGAYCEGGFGGMGMMRGLDLSDEQKDRIKEIFKNQAKLGDEKIKTLGEVREELWKLTYSDAFDATKAHTLAARQADIMIDMQVSRLTAMNQAYQVLDAGQKEKLAQWQDKRSERLKDSGDDDDMPHHGRMHGGWY